MIIFFPLIIFYLINISNTIEINFNNESQKHINLKRSLKILIISPSLSWSHAQYLGRIADTLVEAGHEVVSLII